MCLFWMRQSNRSKVRSHVQGWRNIRGGWARSIFAAYETQHMKRHMKWWLDSNSLYQTRKREHKTRTNDHWYPLISSSFSNSSHNRSSISHRRSSSSHSSNSRNNQGDPLQVTTSRTPLLVVLGVRRWVVDTVADLDDREVRELFHERDPKVGLACTRRWVGQTRYPGELFGRDLWCEEARWTRSGSTLRRSCNTCHYTEECCDTQCGSREQRHGNYATSLLNLFLSTWHVLRACVRCPETHTHTPACNVIHYTVCTCSILLSLSLSLVTSPGMSVLPLSFPHVMTVGYIQEDSVCWKCSCDTGPRRFVHKLLWLSLCWAGRMT